MQKKQALELGSYLRHHREQRGISVRSLATSVGVDLAQIVRLEQGKVASPKADVLAKIARIVQVPLADLFGMAGYTVPADLPSFRPYMRAKYGPLPDSAVAELEAFFTDIARKYGTAGPLDGEDER